MLHQELLLLRTLDERRRPEIINGSRRNRIAQGSGTSPGEVNQLLKQFKQVSQMMKQFSKLGMRGLMRSLGGRLPPGFGG